MPALVASLSFLVLFLAGICLVIAGWVMNVLALVAADTLGVLEFVRMLGIFVPPLGALLGWMV